MVVQSSGVADALHGVVCGDGSGIVCALATNKCAHEGGSIDIAGAVAAVRQQLVLIVCVATVFEDHDAGSAGGIGNTGEDDVLAADMGELFQK